MKFVATLPEAKHFSSVESETEGQWTYEAPGRWIWQDKLTPAIRIQSPHSSPWGKQWKVVPSIQSQRGDGSKWPYRLVLRLFPQDGEGVPAIIQREEVKGVFAWSQGQPLSFYAFPIAPKLWVFYSFYSECP